MTLRHITWAHFTPLVTMVLHVGGCQLGYDWGKGYSWTTNGNNKFFPGTCFDSQVPGACTAKLRSARTGRPALPTSSARAAQLCSVGAGKSGGKLVANIKLLFASREVEID